MNGYVKYKDLIETSQPCENIECKNCTFDNGKGTYCKLLEWLNSLDRYEPRMELIREEKK